MAPLMLVLDGDAIVFTFIMVVELRLESGRSNVVHWHTRCVWRACVLSTAHEPMLTCVSALLKVVAALREVVC
jgi:hypothetical protein